MKNNEPLVQSLLNATQEVMGASMKNSQHAILKVGNGGLSIAEQLFENAYAISQVKSKDELAVIIKKNARDASEKVGQAMDSGLDLARRNINLASFIVEKSQEQVDTFKNYIRKPKSNTW